MKPNAKRALLGAGLLGTLLLAWLAPSEEAPPPSASSRNARGKKSAPVSPLPAASGSAPRSASAGSVRQPLTLPERSALEEVGNLFIASSWYLPPPPPPPPPPAGPPPPPPPPVAPPFPFAYMGQIVEDGRAQFILSRGDRVVTLAIGDTIDKTYKLDNATGGILTFVYLPLNTKQTLATGVSP